MVTFPFAVWSAVQGPPPANVVCVTNSRDTAANPASQVRRLIDSPLRANAHNRRYVRETSPDTIGCRKVSACVTPQKLRRPHPQTPFARESAGKYQQRACQFGIGSGAGRGGSRGRELLRW